MTNTGYGQLLDDFYKGPFAFFSYSHSDMAVVNQFANRLFIHGHWIVFDRELLAGQSWLTKAAEWLGRPECRCAAVFLSRASVRSEAVLAELNLIRDLGKDYFGVMLDDYASLASAPTAGSSPEAVKAERVRQEILKFFPCEQIFVDHCRHPDDSVTKILKKFASCGLAPHLREQNGPFETIAGHEVTDRDISLALELDHIAYEFDESLHFTDEKCTSWFARNNMIYTMVRDRSSGLVVAYTNITPVTDEWYCRIRSGEIADVSIPDDGVMSFDYPGFYKLYMASIVVHPWYRNRRLPRLLYERIALTLIDLLNDGIRVESAVADAITEEGVAVCEKLGMKKVADTARSTAIYEINFIPPDFKPVLPVVAELHGRYRELAAELRSHNGDPGREQN